MQQDFEIILKEEKCIDAKAYLGNRKLVSFEADELLTEVGAWAFSHCINLEHVSFAAENVSFGKDVFLGCEKLKAISIGDGANKELMATAVKLFKEGWVLGAGDEIWYKRFDLLLKEYLKEDDLVGFEGLWTFGEEDYTERTFDENIYAHEKRVSKCNIVLTRLVDGKYLSDVDRGIFAEYLSDLKMNEVLDALLYNHINEAGYYKTLFACCDYNAHEKATMIERLKDIKPEIRAIILGSHNDVSSDDIFASLLEGI